MRVGRIPRTMMIVIAGLAMGADDAVQKVELPGISFEVPKDWSSSKPSSSMRLAQYTIKAADGDTEPAEMVLFAFRGGAGSVKANLERWQAQFQTKEGDLPKLETSTIKAKNTEATLAETSGRYVAAMSPGSPEKFDKKDWRLLGAIVQTPDTGYFFKMVGPDKTVKAAKPAIEAMIKSIEVGKN